MINNRNAELAIIWTKKMEDTFGIEISDSISRSDVVIGFKQPELNIEHKYETNRIINDMTVEEAIFTYGSKGKTCVLNFASYKLPGGRFIDGSSAQEEALCHVSTLYPVLRHFSSEYYRRLKTLNKGLYNEDFIYTPDILFVKDKENLSGTVKCDVLNYAAPCMIRKHKTEEYYKVLATRMVSAFVVPYLHGCDTVILGAWGCGVFYNDPYTVSKIWKSIEDVSYGMYKNIIHPVPIIKNHKNYNAFVETYK